MQFSCSVSSQTEVSEFFSKQSAEAITHMFFALKAFKQLLKNFFEIFRGNCTIMRFVNSLLFLVYQNDVNMFTKAKSCSYSNKY